jgi:DNA-directed RNA polymerase specialized sigma24 family protein
MAQKQARQARLSRFFHKLIGRRAAFTGQAGLGSELNTPDDAVWQAVRGLDEKLRIPIVLRYYHEYPISEIARLLRISEGAVHARLDAAREKIAGGVNLPA